MPVTEHGASRRHKLSSVSEIPGWKLMVIFCALAALTILGGWLLGRCDSIEAHAQSTPGNIRMMWTVYLTFSPAIFDSESRTLDMDALARMCKALDPKSYAHAKAQGPTVRVLCLRPQEEKPDRDDA